MRNSKSVHFGSIRVRPPIALPGERIGLLGGSFNPAHEGHLQISRIALGRLGLSRVWWVVTPGNPLKSRNDLLPLSERVAQCRLIARDGRIVVTTFEEQLATAFTAATLAFLKTRFPGTRFVWLMGADNLATFHRWQDWRGIMRSVPVAVIDRPGNHLPALSARAAHVFSGARLPEARAPRLAMTKAPAWTFLCGRLSPLSSTAIRRARRPAPE